MRDFRIPFSETEAEKLFLGFSLREASVILAGLLVAVATGVLVAVLGKKPLLALVPAVFILPLAYWLARGRVRAVKEDKESQMPAWEFLLRRRSAQKTRNYNNFTR